MKKNIIIIYVDELRFDALGMYGNKQVFTPNLDTLSECSTVFDNHYCSYPVCTPSRFSFLSGQYANQHGVWTNKGTLRPDINTFAKEMKSNGYNTVAIGKMHATPTYLDVGFNAMKLCEQDGDGRFEDDYHKELVEHGLIDEIDVLDQRLEYRKKTKNSYTDSFGIACNSLPEEWTSTGWITKKSIEEIEQWKQDGNLLFISYVKPHHPFDPIPKYIDLYNDKEIEPLPGYTNEVPEIDYNYNKGYFDNKKLTKEILKKMTLYYYANISHIDDGVGRILDKLREKDLFDNAIIFFTSDHGDYMGFHHMALKQNHMYEPLMRIPLLIKREGQRERCRVQAFSDNTQIASEILKMIGCSSTEMNDHSLYDDKDYIVGFFRNDKGATYMIRDKKYKLIIGEKELLLFDLVNDPLELHPLNVTKNTSKVLELKEKLFSHLFFYYPWNNCLLEEAEISSKDRKIIENQKNKIREYYKEKVQKDSVNWFYPQSRHEEAH